MELFAQPVGGAVQLLADLIFQPRQLAQANHGCGGQHETIAAIVLGSRRRVAIPKSVQLLGVDRKHGETVFQQSLDDGAARKLDGGCQNRRGFQRLSAQPVHQLRQAMAVVFHPSLLDDLARSIHQTNPVLVRSPIDAHKMLKVVLQGTQPPPPKSPTRRAEHQPLYWRSDAGRKLPTGPSSRTTTPGRTSPPGARLAQGAIGTPDGRSSPYCLTQHVGGFKGTGGGYLFSVHRRSGLPQSQGCPDLRVAGL